jgi:hypothetical protein
MGLKKDLAAIRKALESLVDKTENLLRTLDNLENQNL